MDWSNEDIIKTYNSIIRDSKEMTVSSLDVKYATFKKSFSKLYDLAIESVASGKVQESHDMLMMMMKARDKMNKGSMTKMTTDMFVGNQLGKKYIYPLTNTPSADDYARAIEKIKTKENEIVDDLGGPDLGPTTGNSVDPSSSG
jgi:hypothetical protein